MHSDSNKIRLVITDVDGVLTDSGYIFSHDGKISKRFNTRDFYALEFIKNRIGIPVMGLSGADDSATIARFEKSKIPLAYGIKNKLDFANKLFKKTGIDPAAVAFIGDHWIDLPLMKICGFPFCPKDAVSGVLHFCKNKSALKGGYGVIEDFLCQIFSENYENIFDDNKDRTSM